VIKSSEERKEDSRIDYSLSQIGRNYVDEILPAGIVETQERHQHVSNEHQASTSAYKVGQLSPVRHHNSRNEPTERRGERWNSQASARFGRAVKEDDLEKERNCKEELEVTSQ